MQEHPPSEFDVIIIGAGSGNSLLTPEWDTLRVAIIEKDLFGGTCMNRGCIPTKMFVYAADVASHIAHSAKYGIDATINKVRWPDIVERVFNRVDPIAPNGKAYRESQDNVRVFTGIAEFVSPKVIEVNGERITAEHIVVAAGARPTIPHIDGLDKVAYHTSDTIMRVPKLPEHLIIFGGGYIATEMAHVFGSLGSRVSIVIRGDRLLAREDESVSERFTELYTKRFDVHAHTHVERVHQSGTEITVKVKTDGHMHEITGDALLIAIGRVPNGDTLNLSAAGIDVDSDGYVITDEYLRTNMPNVWALGDVTNPNQLKHVANAECRAVAHNVIHPESLRTAGLWPIPHAVFADPQVASVGETEQALRAAGIDYITAVQRYGDVAYGWAMEDSEHFCKLIADPHTRQLLGAHIIGPQSSVLIQQLIQGMRFGQTVDQMARDQIYIHPALSELVENALLQL
jgi:mycothione reductase